MRKPKVKNKYNLKFTDIKNLKILDRTQIAEPLFWRNDIVNAWCISENTAKTANDSKYGTYNDYWIGIYDEDAKAFRGKVRASCTSYGGMCGYTFKEFYNITDIENEHDLVVQEKLLSKINELIDKKILGI